MRFKPFLAVITLVLFATVANAQSNAIKINFISPIFQTINVQYENAFAADKSAQLGFFYTGASVSDTKFTGIGITPEVRFYLSDTDAPDGFFVAPFLRYQNFTLEEEITGDEAELSTFGGGLIVGRQWLFKEKITFEAFLGPSYASGDIKVTSGTDSFDTGAFDGFGLRIGFTIGLAF